MRFKIIPGYEIGVYISAKCGIYLVENPDGEVYIGQSRDLPKRVRDYKKGQVYAGDIKHSIFKHGRKNHKFYLLLELPITTDTETLWYFEKLFIRQYRKDGYVVLNHNSGGTGGSTSGKKITTPGRNFYINPTKSEFI